MILRKRVYYREVVWLHDKLREYFDEMVVYKDLKEMSF